MTAPYRLVLATRNPYKVAELRTLLDDLPVELISADALDDPPDVDENRSTLRGNARKKADAFHEQTGRPAVADDTGLEVDALGGAPGVHTARFAGPDASAGDNNELLLRRLDGASDRSARFRTVVVFVDGDDIRYFEGVCEGHIATGPRGDQGFGYDPLFVPDGETRTFAEMNADEKNTISHRKRAVRQFAEYMQQRLTD